LKSREAIYSCQYNIGIISDRIVVIESKWDETEDTGASSPTYVIAEERVYNETWVGFHQSSVEGRAQRTKGQSGSWGRGGLIQNLIGGDKH
jgi:hypothetical protein